MLTATWLLPVALVPMAWDAGDIHGPHLPPPVTQEPVGKGKGKEKEKGKDADNSKDATKKTGSWFWKSKK